MEVLNEMWRAIAMFGTTRPTVTGPFNAMTSTAAVLSCVLIADSTPNDDIVVEVQLQLISQFLGNKRFTFCHQSS